MRLLSKNRRKFITVTRKEGNFLDLRCSHQVMVLPPVGRPEALTSLLLARELQGQRPTRASVVASGCDCKTHFSWFMRGDLEEDIPPWSPRGYVACPRASQQVCRWREKMQTWGSASVRIQGRHLGRGLRPYLAVHLWVCHRAGWLCTWHRGLSRRELKVMFLNEGFHLH